MWCRKLAVAVAFLSGVLAGPQVSAASEPIDWRLSVIVSSPGGEGLLSKQWDANGHGQVLYPQGSVIAGERRMRVSDGENTVIINSGEPTGTSAWLNNTGTAAFEARILAVSPRQDQLLMVNDQGVVSVLDQGEGRFAPVVVSDANRAFWVHRVGNQSTVLSDDGTTIYGTPATTDFVLSMSASGLLLIASGEGLFLYDENGLRQLVLPDGANFDPSTTSVNDAGVVAFFGNIAGGEAAGIYTTDGDNIIEVLPPDTPRPSGQTGMFRPSRLSINNRGEIAWVDWSSGVYVGGDPVAGKVLAVGDVFEDRVAQDFSGKVVINERGQVFFGVRTWLTPQHRDYLVRADPPGATPEHPVMPDPEIPGEGWTFPAPGDSGSACPGSNLPPFCLAFGGALTGTTVRYFDPEVAVGYIYEVTDNAPNFTEVLLPADIGDGLYDLYLHDGETFSTRVPVVGGQIFSFVEDLGLADGVDRFLVLGIEACAQVDPDSPVAFVTGLSFARESTEGGMHMKPIRAQLPECCDGIDNDGDGLIDFPDDPVCASESSSRESSQCQNGIDDDGDGKIDFDGGASWNGGVPLTEPDPECVGRPWRNKEAAGSTCGIGAELAFVVALLAGLKRKARRRMAVPASSC